MAAHQDGSYDVVSAAPWRPSFPESFLDERAVSSRGAQRPMKALYGIAASAAVLLVLTAVAASTFSFSSLPQPGALETWAATKLKHAYISRAARSVPAEPQSDLPSIAAGQMVYGAECSSCHGLDGRAPSDFGRSMYPRVPDLGSPSVQKWSDAELFWIIQNGIRHSGMPGFGKIRSDSDIWDLVHYVRSIRASR
jgi:mono/diheme cytochrome c family protein